MIIKYTRSAIDKYKTSLVTVKSITYNALPLILASGSINAVQVINTSIVGYKNAVAAYILALYLPVAMIQVAIYEAMKTCAYLIFSESKKSVSSMTILNLMILNLMITGMLLALFIIAKDVIYHLFNISYSCQSLYLKFSVSMIMGATVIGTNYILNAALYFYQQHKLFVCFTIGSFVLQLSLLITINKFITQSLEAFLLTIIISNIIIFICLYAQLYSCKIISKKDQYISFKKLIKIFNSSGLPILGTYFVFSVGIIILNHIISQYGTANLTAFGMIMRLQNLIIIPAICTGIATAILINKNIALRNHLTNIALIICALLYAMITVLIYFAHNMIANELSGSLIIQEMISHSLKYLAFSYLGLSMFLCFSMILEQTQQGMRSLIYYLVTFSIELLFCWIFTYWLHNLDLVFIVISLVNSLLLVAVLKEYKRLNILK